MNLKGQKAGHYAFFYYSALLIFSFAVLTAVVLAVFLPSSYARAHDEQPQPVSLCPFEPQSDRYIVDFDRTKKIISSGSLSGAFTSADTLIPDGQYKVTLVASDAYPERVSVIQPNERWYLILKDGSGVIGQTDSTSDVPDEVAAATTTDIVSENFEVSRPATVAVAFHSVYPDTTNANSVFPVCAILDMVPSKQCSDNIDNDGDGKIDMNDSGCSDPDDDDENTPPVITLTGSSTITVIIGQTFTDPGATATDTEDGDITVNIIVTGSVSTSTVGTTTLLYNVSDSDGAAAVEVSRTVVVCEAPPVLSQCSDNIDNDGDGKIDMNDSGCSDPDDDDETDPSPDPNPPPCTENCGGGDGGGGDGGGGNVPIGNGPPEFGAPPPVVNTPMVLGVSTSTETVPMQCNYLLEYLKLGVNNNPVEVYKLQMFLKNFEGFNDLPVTGIFDQPTFEAVSVFQEKYRQDVLEPWGDRVTPGYVYITTKKKVNEIYCRREFPLTDLQKQEIIDFRNLVNSLKTQGVTVPEAEAEEIFGGIGQTEGGQEEFSTSTLAVGINSEENGFQKGAFSVALAYFSGLEFLPSLLLFFLLFTTTSLLLLLRKCRRERI